VAEVCVKEGDRVKAGQVLARLDDRVETARLEQLKISAESTVRVDAAEARLAQNRSDLAKLEKASKKGAASILEVEHARLDVKIGELSLLLAQIEHKQDQLKYKEMGLQVARMRITSPVDGVVEQVIVEKGESVELKTQALRIVRIDPLWIDAPVPRHIAGSLKKGDKAVVIFSNRGDSMSPGTILNIASVEDAASDTRRVRIELKNPENRPAGQRVSVSFSPAVK
jgi:RND family efflux transporter MFP subunit